VAPFESRFLVDLRVNKLCRTHPWTIYIQRTAVNSRPERKWPREDFPRIEPRVVRVDCEAARIEAPWR